MTESDLDFSRLDRTVDRYRLLLLAKRVGKEAGFTPRMLQLLEYYLAYTTAKDWEEGSRPIVFQSLARTAMDLGVGERQIQKLEKRLFEVGAICWNDSGNHKRYGRRCPKSSRLIFAYGVDLTPLAYLEEELQARLHEKQLYAEAWRATKREISESRRKIRERLQQLREEGADASAIHRIEASYREIAYELRSHIDLTKLRGLSRRHTNLLDGLQQATEAQQGVLCTSATTSTPTAPAARKGSRIHAPKVRAPIADHSSREIEAEPCTPSPDPSGSQAIGNRILKPSEFRSLAIGPMLGASGLPKVAYLSALNRSVTIVTEQARPETLRAEFKRIDDWVATPGDPLVATQRCGALLGGSL